MEMSQLPPLPFPTLRGGSKIWESLFPMKEEKTEFNLLIREILLQKFDAWIKEEIGMTGFEPATFCTQNKHATELRHIPTNFDSQPVSLIPSFFIEYIITNNCRYRLLIK